ncbi:MAG: hypothetical protein ACRCS6_12595 [Turicibacter sp.]
MRNPGGLVKIAKYSCFLLIGIIAISFINHQVHLKMEQDKRIPLGQLYKCP